MRELPFRAIQVAIERTSLVVTLNNPARKNAIGPAMANELLHALDLAAEEASVRTVVITGAGDAFCAGGDFSQMVGGAGEATLEHKGDFSDLILRMVGFGKPIIARVNGVAMGGGLGLVSACHFAVAIDSAKLGTPEVNVGLFPMMIMALLARLVPRRRLLEMMLFGEKLSAEEARAVGLVSRVVAAAELDGAVAEIESKIASKSPITIQLGLEAWARQGDMELEAALPYLRERLGACLATDDAREGLTAFLEKRAPRWTGK